MIELQDVTKIYRGSANPSVSHATFSVKAGEIFGFLGPNGAGKTTTIKMITGILPLTQGKITINGCDITKQPTAAKRHIGYVPDGQILYDKLTGREYIDMLSDIYGVSKEDRRIRAEHFLAKFGLEKDFDNQISTYSYGMQQKIAIIGALIHNPDVWILDEPMRGLDPQASYELKQLMREHADQGKTVFFSTHVLEVAEKICDRVGIIKQGNMIAVDSVDALHEQYGTTLEEMFLRVTSAKNAESAEETRV